MMIGVIFLLVGGAALAAAMVGDLSPSEDIEDTESQEDGDIDLDGMVVLDLLSGYMNEDAPSPNDEGAEKTNDDLQVIETADESGQVDLQEPENEFDLIIEVDEQELIGLPSPLADWTLDESVEEFPLGEDNRILIDFPEGVAGSLLILNANYQEIHGSSNEGRVYESSGSNIYFIPEGEKFPENYKWSEEGAALHNIDGHIDEEADFGGIKMLARIDSGSWEVDISPEGDPVLVYDQRAGTPLIQSNLSVVYE